MKTLKKQCEEIVNMPFLGHPSRAEEARLKRLEGLILKLAERIDNLENEILR